MSAPRVSYAAMEFPLTARFRILGLGQQVSVVDAGGAILLFARQKAFRLKEAVTVFADEAQTRPAFTIQADRVLDISARYAITRADGTAAGVLQREGMRSLWRTSYVIDAGAHGRFTIREENPWVKVADGLLEAIPLAGALAGYIFHPRYTLARDGGEAALRIAKQPAFFEGRFSIDRAGAVDAAALDVLVAGTVMMLLLERDRG